MAKSARTYAPLVDGSKKVDLDDYDPSDNGGLVREAAEAETEALGKELAELEDLLFYAGTHSLLDQPAGSGYQRQRRG